MEPINYQYLGLSIVFLILAFSYLNDTKKQIKKKTTDKDFYSSIRVMTSKGEIYMDPNIFEKHMNRLKDRIIALHQNFDQKNCTQLKAYLDNAKIHTEKYINMNKSHLNPSFCDGDVQLEIFNDMILKERTLLKNKLDINITTDEYTDSSDKLKYELLELMVDMDIILFLVRSSLCKKGVLDLACLDQIVLELYRSKCQGNNKESFQPSDNISTLSIPTPCYGGENYYHDANVGKQLEIGPHVGRCDFDQDIPDAETAPIKEILKRQPIDHRQSMITHADTQNFVNNKVRLGKQLDCSDMRLNSLIWEQTTKTDSSIDSNCRTCLSH